MGFARNQGPGRDRRDGLHAVRRALEQGHRRPAHRRVRGDVRVGRHRQGRRRRVLARHRDVGHERHGARPPAPARTTSRSPTSRTSARPPRKRSATPRTRWRAARTTSRWRSVWRRSRTAATRGSSARPRRRPTAPAARSPRPRCSRCARPATARSTASTTSRCAKCSPASRGRTTTTAPATLVRSSRRRSPWRRSRNAPLMAGGLGVYDCSGVADGSAAAIIVRAEDAHKYTDKPIYIKALSLVAGNCSGNADPAYDYTTFPEIAATGRDAYAQAGVTNPREQIAMAEVHDCFTPAELAHLRRPPVRRAGQRVEGSARGHLRPQGRHAGEPRRRPEELRPPGRRVGPAHDVRGVAPAARRSARGAHGSATTARSRSRTTSAATPARWCRSSRSSAASSADLARRGAPPR